MSTNKFLMWLKFGSKLRISVERVFRQICKIIVKIIFMILKIQPKMSNKKSFRNLKQLYKLELINKKLPFVPFWVAF